MIRPWIQTFTGRKFFPLDPRPEDVCIADIAHALSMQCRFLGHTKWFYSVAEHSVRVCAVLAKYNYNTSIRLAGLMHDSAEAYLADVSSPVKQTMPKYIKAEKKLLTVIGEALSIKFEPSAPWKRADLILLSTEKRDLLGKSPASWGHLAKPLAEHIHPWSPIEAVDAFLRVFHGLTEGDLR